MKLAVGGLLENVGNGYRLVDLDGNPLTGKHRHRIAAHEEFRKKRKKILKKMTQK